jgi:hypothetical protein
MEFRQAQQLSKLVPWGNKIALLWMHLAVPA